MRSARRRSSIAARVKENGNNEAVLEVRVPQRLPQYIVDQFLKQNQHRFQRLLNHHKASTPPPKPLDAGRELPLLGYTLTLSMLSQPRRKVIRTEFVSTQRKLWMYVPTTVTEAAVRRALILWYRSFARTYLTERTDKLSRQMGVAYKQIRIKEMRSRWGSCSSLGNLNYKWQIIMAPPEIIDYLVIHELAHRRQPNHSPAFWNIVAAFDSHYKTHRAWLRKHGSHLTL